MDNHQFQVFVLIGLVLLIILVISAVVGVYSMSLHCFSGGIATAICQR